MIADDRRRSRIANRRSQTIAKTVVSIQSRTIANDRRADLCQYFGQRKCQNYRRFTLAGKSHQNNMADAEEEILLQANLFFLLGLKRRHRQLQNRRKHRFWVQKVAFSIASNNDHTLLLCCGISPPPPPQIN